MHLLYLDDAGSAPNADEEYLVLGGVSLYEAQVYWLTAELDKLAESYSPASPEDVEFHASEIFSRREPPWDALSKDDARGVIKSVLRVFSGAYASATGFACAIHKDSHRGADIVELAFEDVCSRFDQYLGRLRAGGDEQRGLIVLDRSSSETSLQQLALNFRKLGNRWGSRLRNIAETPLFLDSRSSRAVQMADHVAYSVFRRYNAHDTQYFDIIAHKFDTADGIIHGLAHKEHGTQNCMCPACLSRRQAGQ